MAREKMDENANAASVNLKQNYVVDSSSAQLQTCLKRRLQVKSREPVEKRLFGLIHAKLQNGLESPADALSGRRANEPGLLHRVEPLAATPPPTRKNDLQSFMQIVWSAVSVRVREPEY
jgi:hypothetical protein